MTGMLINIVGFLFFTALGLLMGYYIVCWITGGNFLNLTLPGQPGPS